MKTGTVNHLPRLNAQAPSITYYRFWIALLVVLISDQVSKEIIVSLSGFAHGHYPPFGGREVVPGFFNLVYATNYGAAWGMLEGFSWLLIVLAFTVMIMIFLFRRELLLHLPVHQWCFGLVSGGIIGNTLDRLFRGHVVDFLDFHLPWYRWPTFNVADSAIVTGTLLYLFVQIRSNKQNPA